MIVVVQDGAEATQRRKAAKAEIEHRATVLKQEAAVQALEKLKNDETKSASPS